MSELSDFKARVARGVADQRVIRAVRLATFRKVEQRQLGMLALRDPEGLRELAARLKQHTLDHLPRYLDQFLTQFERRGGRVHVARDARACREIIVEIARQRGASLCAKSKSMTTEEVHLNDALEAAGVRTVETDLGEFIVQIDHDRPSHIVTPIIHKDRRQVAAAMARSIGCDYTEDPAALTKIARGYLRDVFRRCDLGITGVNFGVAETGTICICTNEGNGRMTVSRPRTHIAVMGIEKLIPRLSDLPVFLKLLARGSTGQPLTVYTTLVSGPRRAADHDGPEELHLVLLDNGRSDLLGGPYAEVLRCIRCGACLNACPVYRNVGGHAYGSVYPGPIGSLVTPLLKGRPATSPLPRASSLCGACYVACPVKINIPELLVKLREASAAQQPLEKRLGIRVWAWMMRTPQRYERAQRWARRMLRPGRDGWVRGGLGPIGAWTKARDLPPPPTKSFRDLWREGLADEIG